jgi:UDP-glucose 4-epimerase
MHFAAHSLVGESAADPLKYYDNNVTGAISLLQLMRKHGIFYIVFSSTAAVYGESKRMPITETEPLLPKNPYGGSKVMVENILKLCDKAYGIKHSILRYFNVAGADESAGIGEAHKHETHIIPLLLTCAMQGSKFKLYGDDYPTLDGTCVRDYIHVSDLVRAHMLALDDIMKNNKSSVYNLGNGVGFSNKEIIDAVRKVTGKSIKCTISDRRPGDPAILVASYDKILSELGWRPLYTSIDDIIQTAWSFHANIPYYFM